MKDVLDVVGSALKHVNSSHTQTGAKPPASPMRNPQRSGDTMNYSVETSGPYSYLRVPSSPHDQTGLPIVILKTFDVKGATKRERFLDVLADRDWSSALVENQVRSLSSRPRSHHFLHTLQISQIAHVIIGGCGGR